MLRHRGLKSRRSRQKQFSNRILTDSSQFRSSPKFPQNGGVSALNFAFLLKNVPTISLSAIFALAQNLGRGDNCPMLRRLRPYAYALTLSCIVELAMAEVTSDGTMNVNFASSELTRTTSDQPPAVTCTACDELLNELPTTVSVP